MWWRGACHLKGQGGEGPWEELVREARYRKWSVVKIYYL